MPNRTYRAVFFDLDGTLLPMDVDAFMKAYFQKLGAYAAGLGVAPADFMAGMKDGIGAMVANDTGAANAELFWPRFLAHAGQDVDGAAFKEAVARFYESEEGFGSLGADVEPNPAAARAVETLAAKGYPLVLATMPMFPRAAVEWRLRWAGVDPVAFARITTYENSTSAKPKLEYFAENLAAAGVEGRDVLMVGNNTKEDLAIRGLGAEAFLVTDYLLDPIGFEVFSVRHGSLEKFANWAESLPACEDPAQGISDALVDGRARERALAANRVAEPGADGASGEGASAGADGFVVDGMEG